MYVTACHITNNYSLKSDESVNYNNCKNFLDNCFYVTHVNFTNDPQNYIIQQKVDMISPQINRENDEIDYQDYNSLVFSDTSGIEIPEEDIGKLYVDNFGILRKIYFNKTTQHIVITGFPLWFFKVQKYPMRTGYFHENKFYNSQDFTTELTLTDSDINSLFFDLIENKYYKCQKNGDSYSFTLRGE